MSKNGYLLNKPFSEFTDKEWKEFEKYLNSEEMKEDLKEYVSSENRKK